MFTALWAGWLALFIVIEAWALIRRKRDDTLSENVWDWFCLRGSKTGKTPWCIIRRILFIGFWAWLSIHFVTGGSWL